MEKEQVCIYHIAEIYLYEYYKQPREYEILDRDEVSALMKKAAQEEARGGIAAAVQYYEKALKWNPVSANLYFKIIDGYFRLNNLEMVHSYTMEAFPYLATRAELAAYYRWLGYYNLEKYHPELSQILYRYSQYFENSETAEQEIRYLETAMTEPMPAYTGAQLQEFLIKNGIPTEANSVTLALLVKAGEEAEERYEKAVKDGNETAEDSWRSQAIDCYQMVYELTQDEEIENRLATLV